jgi:hypothetical protein
MRITAILVAVLGWMTVAQPGGLIAQEIAAIHGHVTNPAGQTVAAGEVRLTTEANPSSASAKFEYTFPLDTSGNYKGTDVKPGKYIAGVFVQGRSIDFMPAPIAAGDDKTLDFDMTRPEYIAKMSPADRQALEEYKKQYVNTQKSGCPVVIDLAYPVYGQPGRWFIKFNSGSDKTVVGVKFEMHYLDKVRDEQPTINVVSASGDLKPGKTWRYNFVDNSAFADAPGGFRIHFVKVLYQDDQVWTATDNSCDGRWVKERGDYVRR